jgi:hypothetical protein
MIFAIAVQSIVLIGFALVGVPLGGDGVILVALVPYLPTIFLISESGQFVGCSNFIEPIILGVPIGMVCYGLLFGFAFRVMDKRREPSY